MDNTQDFMHKLLQEHAKFDDPAWGRFILVEAKNLDETRELYFKTREKLDKARVEEEQLRAYIKVLEGQLTLAHKLIEHQHKVKFPIYTKGRRGRKNG